MCVRHSLRVRISSIHACVCVISSSVRLVTSSRAGMGKSLYVRRLAEISKAVSKVVTIPLHGPFVTSDGLLKQLKESVIDTSNAIIHLDIACTVSVL